MSPLPESIVTENITMEVGSRLKVYAKEWHYICPDKWVKSVVSEGYCLEFASNPPIKEVRVTPLPVNTLQRETLLSEVEALLFKKTIYKKAPKKTGDR